MNTPAALAATLAALLFTGILHAQVPQFLNYQGRVAVNGVNFDGSGQFKFALVDAAGTIRGNTSMHFPLWNANDGIGMGPQTGGGPYQDLAVSFTGTTAALVVIEYWRR